MNARGMDPSFSRRKGAPFDRRDESAGREFLTPEQVARQLGVTPDTVRQWIASRDLAACDVSQSGSKRPTWRIHQGDLEGFLARRKTIQNLPVSRRRAPRLDSFKKYI